MFPFEERKYSVLVLLKLLNRIEAVAKRPIVPFSRLAADHMILHLQVAQLASTLQKAGSKKLC